MIQRIHELVERYAPQPQSVLIQGESGTGKEIVAAMIDEPSGRKPFVTINAPALTPTWIESQLFGHKKGAFTGADKDFKGAFERADGGTVFIDEIAALPLDMQVKLLRVIQEKTIEPVGGSGLISLDVESSRRHIRTLQKG